MLCFIYRLSVHYINCHIAQPYLYISSEFNKQKKLECCLCTVICILFLTFCLNAPLNIGVGGEKQGCCLHLRGPDDKLLKTIGSLAVRPRSFLSMQSHPNCLRSPLHPRVALSLVLMLLLDSKTALSLVVDEQTACYTTSCCCSTT